MRLEAVGIGVAETVVAVGEEVPLDELAVGDEALPERALEGGRRDVVLAALTTSWHSFGPAERPARRLAQRVRTRCSCMDMRFRLEKTEAKLKELQHGS